MNIENWLGEDNSLGIEIWNKKYCFNGESFDQWLDRISEGDEDIKQMIIEQKFLFGGSDTTGIMALNDVLDHFGKY